ncbi:MAG: hypothetical protein ONB48_18975 [candidate division KSB1 bacterium]|nr:hypothetical protein [candidate division KSB1 bacterium]MDZ7276316.1 hypothetical protein [candidate division KSB1 bacterium]MDZ7287731.1 hypothetical protein [candidate division KSB1 bacterium]MDZ7299929.1 hypothetical protein [candidate division KSB1 bacterium]MDZ7305742.1 hypothetical protein [candidate division KSB1 bacterium]
MLFFSLASDAHAPQYIGRGTKRQWKFAPHGNRPKLRIFIAKETRNHAAGFVTQRNAVGADTGFLLLKLITNQTSTQLLEELT